MVKGDQTYEVRLKFDGAGKATKVDVTTNMWRSDATKSAMKGQRVADSHPLRAMQRDLQRPLSYAALDP